MMPIFRAGHWGSNNEQVGKWAGEQVGKRADEEVSKKHTFTLSHFHTSKGFTLIELIIVLVVLSVVSVVAFPRMEAFLSGGYLKSTTRRLIGTIRYLHDRSATTGKRLSLWYDLDENEYWIEEENEEGEFEEVKTVLGRKEVLPEGIKLLDIITPEGKINSGQTFTIFFPKGYVTKSIIHLQNEKEEVQTLLIKGSMGQVMVYEGYVEEESE